MKIHEYQAKEIFRRYGIPVMPGRMFSDAAGVEQAAAEMGCPVFVKAQVHAGGRGKGGGVRKANSPAEAASAAKEILGMKLTTAQTGSTARTVRKILVEKAADLPRASRAGHDLQSVTHFKIAPRSLPGTDFSFPEVWERRRQQSM